METFLVRLARAILREFDPTFGKPRGYVKLMRVFPATNPTLQFPVIASATDAEGHPTGEEITLVVETENPAVVSGGYDPDTKLLTLNFGTVGDSELRLTAYNAAQEPVGDYREIIRLVPGPTAGVAISVDFDGGISVLTPTDEPAA